MKTLRRGDSTPCEFKDYRSILTNSENDLFPLVILFATCWSSEIEVLAKIFNMHYLRFKWKLKVVLNILWAYKEPWCFSLFTRKHFSKPLLAACIEGLLQKRLLQQRIVCTSFSGCIVQKLCCSNKYNNSLHITVNCSVDWLAFFGLKAFGKFIQSPYCIEIAHIPHKLLPYPKIIQQNA